MKKQLLIFGMFAAILAACSSENDAEETVAARSAMKPSTLQSNVPIEFEVYGLDGDASFTRGALDGNNVSIDNLGIFCLAKRILNQDAVNAIPKREGATPITWYLSAITDQYQVYKALNVWQNNIQARMVSTGDGSSFQITYVNPWDNVNYPANDAYSYGFAAYYPRTEWIRYRDASRIDAFVKIDGNDDVIFATSKSPSTLPVQAYSAYYYDNWTIGAKPVFQFKHMTSRLDFYIKLDAAADLSKNYYLDSVVVENFPHIMMLTMVRSSSKVVAAASAYCYVQNQSGCDTVPFLKDEKYTGNFYLRAAGDGSLRNAGIQLTTAYPTSPMGDGIMIPPVHKTNSVSSLNIKVYLRDDDGNIYHNGIPFVIPAPTTGFEKSKRYKVSINVKPSTGHSVVFGAHELVEWSDPSSAIVLPEAGD